MAFCGMSEDLLKQAFEAFDADKSGFIDRAEMLNVMNRLAEIGAINADSDECKASTKDIIDKSNACGDADNKISFEEFKKVFEM